MWKESKGPTGQPKFCLELKEVNAKDIGYVVEKEFGDGLQAAGIEIVIVDNVLHDQNNHSGWFVQLFACL